MDNQVIDLELALLKVWSDAGIKEIYKYKNRIKIFKEPHLHHNELFYDLTYRLYQDIEDIANHRISNPEEHKVSVESLIKNREVSSLQQIPNFKPGDKARHTDLGEVRVMDEPLISVLKDTTEYEVYLSDLEAVE